MEVVSIIFIVISLIVFAYSFYTIKNIHRENIDIDKLNKEKEKLLNQFNEQIKSKEDELAEIEKLCYNKNIEYEYTYNQQQKDLNTIKENIQDKQQELINLQNNVTKSVENQKQLSQLAFESYCNTLLKDYDEKEKEHNQSLDLLHESYSAEQDKILKDLQEQKDKIAEDLASERAELEKIRQTRSAAQQAQLKEKEIKENRAFYCLTIKDSDLLDIKILEKIKPQLNNPRILSMLIWSTYFQKPMTALCNNIIGTETKSGIYKITNQLDDCCYIGQAVDLATRWKQHAKCGLGIDTPQGNKLYKAMQEDGLWNFSFEVLEFCPSAELNEKEKYYIELYQSKDYGYNTLKGISK